MVNLKAVKRESPCAAESVHCFILAEFFPGALLNFSDDIIKVC